MPKLLLVEDDENLGPSLKKFITSEGHDCVHVDRIEKAKEQDLKEFDLVILDWMLPDGQGIDFLKGLRPNFPNLPVIMLTARTELIDKVIGLESGANDYVVKPFEPRELAARIRVQLRLGQNSPAPAEANDGVIQIGELSIDPTQRKVEFEGKEVDLTKMEFDFLRLLAENPNRAFSRDEILNKVWGYENYPTTRTVDTHVLQLRQKLRDDLIETVRGIGYRMKGE